MFRRRGLWWCWHTTRIRRLSNLVEGEAGVKPKDHQTKTKEAHEDGCIIRGVIGNGKLGCGWVGQVAHHIGEELVLPSRLRVHSWSISLSFPLYCIHALATG
jgi:hypothetical protein